MASARTLQRGLEVLAAVRNAGHQLSAADIARITGLDRAVIRRLLPPLIEAGFVATEGPPPRYTVGPSFGLSAPLDDHDEAALEQDLVDVFARTPSDDTEGSDSGDRAQSWDEGWDEGWHEVASPYEAGDPTSYFDTASIDDAYYALMSFVGGMPMAFVAEQAFGQEIPSSFMGMMGDLELDDLGPDYGTIVEQMREIDPAVAFRVFFSELDERDQEILHARFSAHPETLEAIAERYDITRERVRQIVKKLRRSFEARLESNMLMIQRTELARAAIGGIVEISDIQGTLLVALPMVDYLAADLDEALFFLLFPEGHFTRYGDESPWFVDDDVRLRLTGACERALTEGMPSEEFTDVVPELRSVADPDGLLATIGLEEVDGEFVQRDLSMTERAVRLLRRTGSPLEFDGIVEALHAGGRTRYLRNALLADERIIRVDRDLFALEEWGLPIYSTVRDLMRQEIEASGGEADIAGMKERLTARFDIKASSIDAYARGPEFVRTAPGVIRLRGENEEVEDLERPLHTLRGCVRVGRRWALRVEVTGPILRGFSVTLPRGMGPHFGVPQGESATLRTDRSDEISVVRRGLQDNIGRLRWVAEELGLSEGDVLFVLLPERKGGRISFSSLSRADIGRANARKRAGLLLGQDKDLSLALACSALGMPRASRPAEVTDRLRSRGEHELAALVGEVLGEGTTTGVDTSDIARMLGLR